MPLRVLYDFCINLIDFFDTFLCEHFLGCAEANDMAVLHDKESVTVHCCDVQVMDRRDDGQIKAFYDIHQLQLILDIEVVRRFVKDQARRLLRKRAGQNDPLLFAAR